MGILVRESFVICATLFSSWSLIAAYSGCYWIGLNVFLLESWSHYWSKSKMYWFDWSPTFEKRRLWIFDVVKDLLLLKNLTSKTQPEPETKNQKGEPLLQCRDPGIVYIWYISSTQGPKVENHIIENWRLKSVNWKSKVQNIKSSKNEVWKVKVWKMNIWRINFWQFQIWKLEICKDSYFLKKSRWSLKNAWFFFRISGIYV